MKQLFYSILLLLFLYPNLALIAQVDSSDFSYKVKLQPDYVNFSGSDTAYFHKLEMTLSDTVQVSKISVKIGSAIGLDDVTNYDFEFDVKTFLPNGYSYFRKGNVIYLTLGKYLTGTYFYEVKLIDTNGIGTVPKKWN